MRALFQTCTGRIKVEMPEDMLICLAVRNAATEMHRMGVNPIEMLHWAEGRRYSEVKIRIQEIRQNMKIKKLTDVWQNAIKEDFDGNVEKKEMLLDIPLISECPTIIAEMKKA